MSDDEEAEGPVVELGSGDPVEGAPLARVAARLQWGMAHSEVVDREGDTVVRTPDGPRQLGDLLADVDEPYFDRRQAFEAAVRDAMGRGPVPTGTADRADGPDEAESGGEDGDAEPDGAESGGEDGEAGPDEDADEE